METPLNHHSPPDYSPYLAMPPPDAEVTDTDEDGSSSENTDETSTVNTKVQIVDMDNAISLDKSNAADNMKGEIALSVMSEEPFIAYSTTGQLNICPICLNEPISAVPTDGCGHAICWSCQDLMDQKCPYCNEIKNYIRIRCIEAVSIDTGKHVARLEAHAKRLTEKIGNLAKMDNMVDALAALQTELDAKNHELKIAGEQLGMTGRLGELRNEIETLENKLGQAASMEYLQTQVSGLIERNDKEEKRYEELKAKMADLGTTEMLFEEMEKLTKTVVEKDTTITLLHNRLAMITGIIEGSHVAVTTDDFERLNAPPPTAPMKPSESQVTSDSGPIAEEDNSPTPMTEEEELEMMRELARKFDEEERREQYGQGRIQPDDSDSDDEY